MPEIYNLYLNIYKINCDYTYTDAGTICEYAEHINEGIDLNYQRKYNKDKFLLIKEINDRQAIKIDKLNRKYIFDLINMIYLNKDGSIKIEFKRK